MNGIYAVTVSETHVDQWETPGWLVTLGIPDGQHTLFVCEHKKDATLVKNAMVLLMHECPGVIQQWQDKKGVFA